MVLATLEPPLLLWKGYWETQQISQGSSSLLGVKSRWKDCKEIARRSSRSKRTLRMSSKVLPPILLVNACIGELNKCPKRVVLGCVPSHDGRSVWRLQSTQEKKKLEEEPIIKKRKTTVGISFKLYLSSCASVHWWTQQRQKVDSSLLSSKSRWKAITVKLARGEASSRRKRTVRMSFKLSLLVKASIE